MGMLAATLALLMPLAAAGDGFGRMLRPASTFAEIVISKADSEHEWPFSIDKGELTCVQLGEQRAVFFREILTPEESGTLGNMTLLRMVVVTANPLAFFATFEDRELYSPFDSLETLIRRLAPFEVMGRKLCERDPSDPQRKEL